MGNYCRPYMGTLIGLLVNPSFFSPIFPHAFVNESIMCLNTFMMLLCDYLTSVGERRGGQVNETCFQPVTLVLLSSQKKNLPICSLP